MNYFIPDTKELVANSQELIDIIVRKYIRTGAFVYDEKEDLIQTINEVLISRIPKIKEQYKGIARFRTYLSTIINNICLEVLKKKKKQVNTTSLDLYIDRESKALASDSQLIINQEIERLDKILNLFFSFKWKIILCLKLRYRFQIGYSDINSYGSQITLEQFLAFKKELEKCIEGTDLEIYETVIQLINIIENKNTTTDSLRRWVKEKINEIVKLLNGNPPTSNYNEETFQILFERYSTRIKEERSRV